MAPEAEGPHGLYAALVEKIRLRCAPPGLDVLAVVAFAVVEEAHVAAGIDYVQPSVPRGYVAYVKAAAQHVGVPHKVVFNDAAAIGVVE